MVVYIGVGGTTSLFYWACDAGLIMRNTLFEVHEIQNKGMMR
jgi:hypothetical protein